MAIEVVMQRPARSFAQPRHASISKGAAADPYRSAPTSISISLADHSPMRIPLGIALLCGGIVGVILSARAREWLDLVWATGVACAGMALLAAIGAFSRKVIVEAGELRVRGQRNKPLLSCPIEQVATIATVQRKDQIDTTFGGAPIGRTEMAPIYFVRVRTKDGAQTDIGRFSDPEGAWWLEDVLRPPLRLHAPKVA